MLDDLTGVFIRGITETTKCFIFFSLCIAIIGLQYSGEGDFHLIAIVGVVLYLIATITIDYLSKKNKGKGIKYILAIIIEILIALLLVKNIPWQYKPYCILYFLFIVFYATIHYDKSFYESRFFLIKYLYSSFVMLCLFLGFTLKSFPVIKSYLLFYIIMSIIYLMYLNIMDEYRDVSANLINKNKNLKRFNIIAVFITVSSYLIFITDFFKRIFDIAYYLVQNLFYQIIIHVSPIIYWLSNKIVSNEAKLKELASKGSIDENSKLLDEMQKNQQLDASMVYDNPTVVIVIKVILLVAFISLICGLMYITYRKFITTYKIEECDIDSLDGEERSFVFKKEKIEKERKKKINLKNLHVIRRIYIDVIKTLNGRGIDYKDFYTPNEYNLFIQNTNLKYKNVGELVNVYNRVRYGNKNISKEDIDKAYKIKENL